MAYQWLVSLTSAVILALPGAFIRGGDAPPTMEAAYPGLATGVLAPAVLGELPKGLLLRAGDVEVTEQALDELIAKSPRKVREELRKNTLFLLEELAAEKLLLAAAKKAGVQGKTDREVAAGYVKGLVAEAKVTDAEVADFYEKNKDAFGDVKLEQARAEIQPALLHDKQQEIVARHAKELAAAGGLTLSAAWVKEQVALVRDNPVDKARASGKPSVVDFGATGCRPCVLMEPILKALQKKLEGKANVVFIHVREQQILANRFRIQSIPAQVFFDRDGREVSRHVGFLSQEELEKKLGEMGVR